MTKVYPNAAAAVAAAAAAAAALETQTPCPSNSDGNCVMLTVWKKSLLFNGDGFTVFDGKGNLVFRVDNYWSGTKDDIILMDASGDSLLTIHRKSLSLSDKWLIYDGESTINPMLTVRKHVNLLHTKSLAYASSGGSRTGIGLNKYKSHCSLIYEIEGSYTQRCCSVYDTTRRRVAEIKRKESLGGVSFGMDVFRLIVHPEIESTVAMALLILLDQMFGSAKRFSI